VSAASPSAGRGERLAQQAIILFAAALVIYPIGWLLYASATPGGQFGLEAYVALFANPELFGVFLNSLWVAGFAALIALGLGVPLAFLAVKSDLQGRWLISLCAMVPLITPPFIGALAWAVLGAPQTGLLNLAGRWLGLTGPWLNIYSVGGMVFCLGIYMSPYVYVLTAGVLAAIDPALEEAAETSGSSPGGVFGSVVLPLAIPGIGAAALIAFLNAIEQFGIPAILGRPANVFLLPTEIYRLMGRMPPNLAQAAATAMLLMVLSAAAVALQQFLVTRRSYVTVSGKGFRQKRFTLGLWRAPAYALVIAFALLAVVLPVLALLVNSLLDAGFVTLTGNAFSLQHYVYLWSEYPAAIRSLRNGTLYAALGATVALLLAAVGAYYIARYRTGFARFASMALALPLALPGIAIGTGLMLAYIRPPLVLYGTMWILIVSYITRFLPLGERAVAGALLQIDRSLEEASAVCGASWFTTFRWVLLPLIRPALIGGWLLLFISMLRELGTSVLLYSFGQEVPAVVLFDMFESGNLGAMSAYATVLLIFTLMILIMFQKFMRSASAALD
jgi:iron(III) transport system permease protein